MALISHWHNNKNVPSTHYDHSGCIAMHCLENFRLCG
jgi:hypothetical protein